MCEKIQCPDFMCVEPGVELAMVLDDINEIFLVTE